MAIASVSSKALARLGEAVLVGVQDAEVVERRRDVGPVGGGVRLGELAVRRERLSKAWRASAKRRSSRCKFPRLLSVCATSGR